MSRYIHRSENKLSSLVAVFIMYHTPCVCVQIMNLHEFQSCYLVPFLILSILQAKTVDI